MEIEQTINEKLKEYYRNDGRKICQVVNKLLFKLKFHDVDVTDFYSLANEVIAKAIKNYDCKQDFDGYIYRCLENKFKTEMTRRNRIKRKADKDSVSIDTPINSDESNCTLADMISDKHTIEKDYFEENEEVYSKCMCKYLSKLSNLQREVLRLISIGFMPSEILEELHINQKMYEDCCNAIHSYRNTAVLM